MKLHLRVFISSTMDLKEERNAINEVVNQIEGIPIRMEFFTARSQSPEEVCIEEVSKCDLYVGIFGKGYGFIPIENNPRRLSATAIEFEKARELNIPTLIFVQRNVEREPELEEFLNRISDFKKGIFRRTFDSLDKLKYWVLASFVFHLSNKTRKAEERDKLENLIMNESLYRRYVKKTCEYVDLKGIYQLRRVVQLRLDDIYVPLKLRRLTALQEQSLEISAYEIEKTLGLEIAVPSLASIIQSRAVPSPRLGLPREESTGPLDSTKSEMELQKVLSANKKIVILGALGSGKTTILRHLAGALIRNSDSSLTPFLVPLREYGRYLKSETNLSILGYLKRYFSSHGLQLPEDFFERHFSSGGCVVMLDGLDEILNERYRMSAASQIEEFAACFSEGNMIVVSSRIPAYRTVQLSGFDHYAIRKLDSNQISEFISRWFEIVEGVKQSDERRRLISLVNSDANLLSLSMNPLMLSLICLISLQGIPIPRKKADLYNICIKTLVSSWEAKKGFKGILGEPQRFEVLKRIAFSFLEEMKITTTEYEILSFIEQFLKKANLPENESRNQAMALLKSMTERTGLLIEREPSIYGFVHLGLRDYLASLHLAGVDNVKDMFNTFLLPRLHNTNYENVICLCSRCLAHQSISRALILLNSILNAKTPYEEYAHLDLVLATKCLFSSGVSYGELVRKILEKTTSVLKSGSDDERSIMMDAFEEIDFELFEGFLCTLVKELKVDVAINLMSRMSYGGMIPEEGQFSDIALKLLQHEVMTSSEFSREASSVVGIWAARGSMKALKLAFEIIEKGVKEAEKCARTVVPITRRDPNLLKKLLQIIDKKDSRLRRYLLLTLYDIAPDRVIEKATSICEDKNEDLGLRKIAKQIQKYHKMTKEEARSLLHTRTQNFIESLLRRKKITTVTDNEALELLLVGMLSEQILSKILNELPKIFEANKVLAFRLSQLLNYYTDAYPALAREVMNFAKILSEEGSTHRRLLAYLIAEVEILGVSKNKELLIELAEDKEEFVVARRAAINRLMDTAISRKDYTRLLKLSSDEEINSNLFLLLSTCDFDRNALMEVISEEIKKGKTNLLRTLGKLIQLSYAEKSTRRKKFGN